MSGADQSGGSRPTAARAGIASPARPLDSGGGRRRQLTAWRVADISRERARQESVFQELQHAIDYLDHAPAGFLSAEPDGRIVYLNATLAEWLGIDLTRFEPGSMTLTSIVRGDAIALLASPTDEEMRNRTAIIDLDLVKQNGQSLPVRLLHRVPVTADGAPGATRTLVLNRSPGEESSEALRAAEVRFSRFFNNTPIAIAAIDEQGRIGRSNAPFLRLFGTSIMGGGSRRLVDLVIEADRPKLEAALKAAVETPRAESRTSTLRSPPSRNAARASTSTRFRKAPAAPRRSSSTPSTSPSSARWKIRSASSRRWIRSVSWPAASPTTSTTC